MERLDKVISMQTEYSRKDVKKLILQKRVRVNNELISKSEEKVNENTDIITIDGQTINIQQFVYLILNKPKLFINSKQSLLLGILIPIVFKLEVNMSGTILDLLNIIQK